MEHPGNQNKFIEDNEKLKKTNDTQRKPEEHQ